MWHVLLEEDWGGDALYFVHLDSTKRERLYVLQRGGLRQNYVAVQGDVVELLAGRETLTHLTTRPRFPTCQHDTAIGAGTARREASSVETASKGPCVHPRFSMSTKRSSTRRCIPTMSTRPRRPTCKGMKTCQSSL
jgi:hypothetical protein